MLDLQMGAAAPGFGVGGMWLHPDEMIVDNFAGGGGASTGIEQALHELHQAGHLPTRRHVDIAINHDPEAVAMHKANHPATQHLCQNIWQVDPAQLRRDWGNRPLGLAWFSPDCTHHSKAKGGKPVERGRRDLGWVVLQWLDRWPPRVFILENVEEFQDWCDLIDRGDGKLVPDPDRKGETFRRWCREIGKRRYRLEFVERRACKSGTPTLRKRLFIIGRRDGLEIVWPVPTHDEHGSELVRTGVLHPYRTAADIIDWSLPCPSIFETSEEIKAKYGIRANRPLKPNTMARIAKGVMRYVVNHPDPFIVPITHSGDARVHPIDDPLRTITTANRGEHALVTPFIARADMHQSNSACVFPAKAPVTTVTTAAGHAVVAPVLVGIAHGESRSRRQYELDAPLPTVTGCNTHAVVAPYLVPRYGERDGQEPRTIPVDQPMPTLVPTGNEGSLAAIYLDRQFTRSVGQEVDAPAATDTGIGKTNVAAGYVEKFSENSSGSPADEPVHTVMAGAPRHAVVSAFLAQHNTDMTGHDAREPVSTIVSKGCTQAVVSAGLVNLKGSDRRMAEIEAPVPTLCARGNHVGEVRAFIAKYYGAAEHGQDCREPLHTDTSKPRFGLVVIHGEPYEIVDIGMRMLTPRERFRAQGFPDSYIIDPEFNGKPLTAEAQGRMCGNSVCPPEARALVLANLGQPSGLSDAIPSSEVA